MRWKESSLQLLGTTSLADTTPVPCQNGRALPVSVIENMEALGTLLTTSGNPVCPIRHRLSKASSAFWANQSTYCCKELSLHIRFKEFVKRVQPVALYGSGSWIWSRSTYNDLVRWETVHLRRISCFRRMLEEDFIHCIKRATHKARSC